MDGDGLVCVVLFTLTFDSSPIKGEGILSVCVVLLSSSPRPVVSRLRGNDGVAGLAWMVMGRRA